MLSKERHFRILDLIDEKSFVTIQELMQILHASKSTISRDLLELEKQGKIQRERGGAVKKQLPETLSSFTDMPVFDKVHIHAQEKEAICHCASQIIKDGDCIYIDSGTTPTYLIPFLQKRNLKIVTSSNYVLRNLPKNFKGDLYMLGGHYLPSYDMSVGPMTTEYINKFHFDHAFFSTSGIDLSTGEVMAIDFEISDVKSCVMKRCKHSHLLVDDSKLSLKALCTWAHVSDFAHIYINDFAHEEELPENIVLCK